MKRGALLFSAAVLLGMAWPVAAQWRVGPIYPPKQSSYGNASPPNTPPNYNPYQFNWHSGRFDYVPIPYEPERPGANYDPYRFNWHSGRWDYVPIPSAGTPYSSGLPYGGNQCPINAPTVGPSGQYPQSRVR